MVAIRQATLSDVPAMSALREAVQWEGGAPAERMRLYLAGEHHPRHALAPRAAFVADRGEAVIGYAAVHLTRRFGCEGELEWLLVAPEARGSGLADRLLRSAAGWLVQRGAHRVCVDVAPDNTRARRFYRRHGATDLDRCWMAWDDIAAALDGPAS
ncbi:MAG TPA: GNAT family N-acetyltransferase [Candidatus Eisenbacteria bacterium]|nr:GNAT family N-acetyltransferase [Candidatus Eisenbacteria bacterium]